MGTLFRLPGISLLAVCSNMMGYREGVKVGGGNEEGRKRMRERERQRKERKLSGGFSYKGANPIITAQPSISHLKIITSQRLYLLTPSH